MMRKQKYEFQRKDHPPKEIKYMNKIEQERF